MHAVTTSPERYPHKCRACNTGDEGNREYWIDFGESENPPGDGPSYTTTYLCSACLTEIAVSLGFTTPTERIELDSRLESLGTELFEARIKADGLEQGLNGLLRARFVDSSDAGELAGLLESVVDDPGSAAPEGSNLGG